MSVAVFESNLADFLKSGKDWERKPRALAYAPFGADGETLFLLIARSFNRANEHEYSTNNSSIHYDI